MDRSRANAGFGQHRPHGGQSPLVEDVKQQRLAGRKPTSHLEMYWPFYLGFGIPTVIFGALSVGLIASAAGSPIRGTLTLAFASPIILLVFLVMSLALVRLFSSVRGSAETLGNITFLTKSNTGFKLGAALGLSLFFWFTPAVFGDPFTGNPSAPSAIVAQLILKALAFMGFVGMIGSRIEKFAREKLGTDPTVDPFARALPEQGPSVLPPPSLPAPVRALLDGWPNKAAMLIASLGFVIQLARAFADYDNIVATDLIASALFCFAAYLVLKFYLLLVDGIVRRLSGLYGFTAKAD